MRINLQRFTLSTLTFSLATTLAVGGFSESANAQRTPGGSYGSSQNLPALNFNFFLKNEDGTDITDAENDNNLGVFKNAIEIINIPGSDTLTRVRPSELENDAVLKGVENNFLNMEEFTFDNGTVASLSAEFNDDEDEITYQIFLGDYNNPDQFLKFAPINISSRLDDKVNLVNNLEFIFDDGKEGTYNVTGQNNFKPEEVGVLGKAIGQSLIFQEEENPKEEPTDFLKITKFDSPPSTSTSIPEPTTTLASVFALAFAGKFLRKSKKSNA